MDRAEALKATRNGAIAATISGIITLVVVLFALSSNANGDLGLWNDPLNFFDIALVFLCAFGIYRKSRAAAIVLFLYFIFAKVIIGLSLGRVPGLLISLIFFYYFAKAIQGTVVFHRIEKKENPEYRGAPSWYYFVGIPVGLCFMLLLGFGALTMTGLVPATEVLSGEKVPASHVEILVEQNIIESDEKIAYFYSAGLFSILEDGNLLTDRRVVSYFKNKDGELEVYELLLPDVRSIELVQQGSYFSDSVYQVNSYDDDAWFQVLLSTESQGDIQFVEGLRKLIGEAQ
ncbi:hypothetical protein [Alishewanella longhuensis]